MKHLFEDWGSVQDKIRRAQNLFLFLDYDGTLTPLVSSPEMALCPPEVKVLLEKLRDSPNVLLAIISGRSLEDIREKVGVPGIIYVGSHGLDIQNPAGVHKKKLSPSREKELRKIIQSLQKSFGEIPEIFFEDKGSILAVHYRNVDRENSRRFSFDADYVIIHDPQPAALIENRLFNGKWIWRCHIDISRPQWKVWSFLRQFVVRYDAAISAIGPAMLQRIRRRVVREMTRAFTKNLLAGGNMKEIRTILFCIFPPACQLSLA